MNKFIILLLSIILLSSCSGGGGSSLVSSVKKEVWGDSQSSSIAGPPGPPGSSTTKNSQSTPVTITSTIGGSVYPFMDETENLIIGDEIYLVAYPTSGWRFDHWETNGDLINSETDVQNGIIIIDGLTINAVFAQVVSN